LNLFAWIDNDDLTAAKSGVPVQLGPIRRALESEPQIACLVVMSNRVVGDTQAYADWLRNQCPAVKMDVVHVPQISPVDYAAIYTVARENVEEFKASSSHVGQTLFHMSCGSPAMRTAWVLLAQKYQARLIQTAPSTGIEYVDFPFDISAAFLRDAQDARDRRLAGRLDFPDTVNMAFKDIIHKDVAMIEVIDRAKRYAGRDAPVLINGESGTGKELFAQAIHNASSRASKTFLAMNCGAIPENLVESELFGHEKDAFTGAGKRRQGWFESANGGTLFLDEIGELPLAMQVRLLRVLQTGEVTRVGSTESIKVDVRIISATNRNLQEEVRAGRFREDLYYRLGFLILKLPALRERGRDLLLLIENELEVLRGKFGFTSLTLAPSARDCLLAHHWPGNIRELQNTMGRLAIETDGGEVTASNVESALSFSISKRLENPESISLDSFPVDIDRLALEAQQPYIEAALKLFKNKTKAAEQLGLGSQQVLSNRLKKLEESQSHLIGQESHRAA
jgi:DNA-binding NtrC family response regulator